MCNLQDIHVQVNVYLVNYIYKQIHIDFFFNLYSFIETHFLVTENSYGRSLSLRRHTNLADYST